MAEDGVSVLITDNRANIMATRIGVDIGGTFTDLIFYDDESGEAVIGKVPTTPHSPDEGVISAVKLSVPESKI